MAQSQQSPSSSIEDDVIVAETSAAVKEAIAALPVNHRSLIQLLMADPAPSYEQVSAILRIPVGSIGPTRGRCLAKLRTQLAVTEAGGGFWPSQPERSRDVAHAGRGAPP